MYRFRGIVELGRRAERASVLEVPCCCQQDKDDNGASNYDCALASRD